MRPTGATSASARSAGRRPLSLGVNRLTALEHFDERRDLLLPPGYGLRVVHAKGQRESVLRAEPRQHPLGLRLRVDGSLEIVGDRHVLAASVGAIPAPVGLRCLHLLEPMLGHPAFRDQPGDVVDIDLAPDAALAAARVALQITLVVKALAHRAEVAQKDSRFSPRLSVQSLRYSL